MKKSQKKIQKLITFPQPIYLKITEKAEKRGLLFPEYVRHVLLNDIEEDFKLDIEIADDDLEKALEASFQDIQNGNTVIVDPHDEISMEKELAGFG